MQIRSGLGLVSSEAVSDCHQSSLSSMSIDVLKSLLESTATGVVSFEGMGEVHGTLRVERSVSLSIRGTTLIGRGAPALAVSADALLDLRYGQVTTTERDPHAVANGQAGDWRAGAAIQVDSGGGVSLTDVELVGDVSGDCPLAGEWHLPSSWVIQELPARARTILAIRGYVPYRVEVISDIHGVASTHPSVGPGPVDFSVDVDARDFEAGALLDGWIRFCGGGTVRRLRLRARLVAAKGKPALPPPLWEARAFASPPAPSKTVIRADTSRSGGGRIAVQKPAGLSGIFGTGSMRAGGPKQPPDALRPQPAEESPLPCSGPSPSSAVSPPAHGQPHSLSPVFGKRPANPSGFTGEATPNSSSFGPADQPDVVREATEEQAREPAPTPASTPVMNRGGISAVFRRPGGPPPPPPA
jgi:hypothetical protein